MMVRFSTDEDIEQLINNQEKWSIHIMAANGAVNLERYISSRDVQSFKHTSNGMNEHDWSTMVYRICFHELKPNERRSHVLSAKLTGDGDTVRLHMDISIVSGPEGAQLKKRLGEFTLGLDQRDPDKYDLFGWTREMKDERDALKDNSDELQIDNAKLKAQLDDFLDKEALLVEQSLQKEEHQMKVFTKLINDMKIQYIKLQKGEAHEEEDLINIEKILQANEMVELEQPKKKIQKEAKPKVKKETGNDMKEEAPERGVEVADVETSMEPKKALKRTMRSRASDPEPVLAPPPAKAESMQSVHFQFQEPTEDKSPEVKHEGSVSSPNDLLQDEEGEKEEEGEEVQDTEEDTDEGTDSREGEGEDTDYDDR